jgi:hypothetical protein
MARAMKKMRVLFRPMQRGPGACPVGSRSDDLRTYMCVEVD